VTEHTKEPWAVSRYGDIQGPDCADGDAFVAIRVCGSTRQSRHGVARCKEAGANLQRAVDCVNALAGLNPSAVAALIEAAENAVLEAPSEGGEPWLLALETAIANIRGEQA